VRVGTDAASPCNLGWGSLGLVRPSTLVATPTVAFSEENAEFVSVGVFGGTRRSYPWRRGSDSGRGEWFGGLGRSGCRRVVSFAPVVAQSLNFLTHTGGGRILTNFGDGKRDVAVGVSGANEPGIVDVLKIASEVLKAEGEIFADNGHGPAGAVEGVDVTVEVLHWLAERFAVNVGNHDGKVE
jgi:hypothetical protein